MLLLKVAYQSITLDSFFIFEIMFDCNWFCLIFHWLSSSVIDVHELLVGGYSLEGYSLGGYNLEGSSLGGYSLGCKLCFQLDQVDPLFDFEIFLEVAWSCITCNWFWLILWLSEWSFFWCVSLELCLQINHFGTCLKRFGLS